MLRLLCGSLSKRHPGGLSCQVVIIHRMVISMRPAFDLLLLDSS